MKPSIESKRFRDLLRLLAELQRLHERLASLGDKKLDAIRRADVRAIGVLTDDEREVACRIHEREGLRRQLMDGIGTSLGLPPGTARAMPVSQLASRIPVSQRTVLQATAQKLRDTIARVARVNRVIGAVSRQVLGHLGRVLESVGAANEHAAGYGGDGAPVTGVPRRIFETVG